MGVDYWQRIIELERRQMRFDMNRQETETRLTQAQNRVNIISSGNFASIYNVVNFAMYPTITSLQYKINSFRVLTNNGWETKTFWNFFENAITGLNYGGIDEPYPAPAGQTVAYNNTYTNNPHASFFDQQINLTYQSTQASGTNINTIFTGALTNFGQTQDNWAATFTIVFDTVTGKSYAISKLIGYDNTTSIYFPFTIQAETISSDNQIAAQGTTGQLTTDKNGIVAFQYRNSTTPVTWTPGFFRNPIFTVSW